MDLLIHGGMVVTMGPEGTIWKEGALVIKGDRIHDLGPGDGILKSHPDIPKAENAIGNFRTADKSDLYRQ